MAPASDDRGNERTGGGGGGGEAEAEEKTDGWLTTYADMVTLLLTFFVLMLAMSSTDTAKMEMFMLALSRDGITAEQFMEIQEKYDLQDRDINDWDEEFPNPDDTQAEYQDMGGQAAMQELADKMQEYIDDEQLGEVMNLTFNGDFLMITLASDILFGTGEVTVTPEMAESARIIAGMIDATFVREDPFEIVVAGHTDNVPINTPQYPSNWHISRDRAVNYLWELLSNSDLLNVDPGTFTARACGEYRPIASNDTEEGRRLNRRVEVMVSLARENPLWEGNPATQTQPQDANGYDIALD